MAYVWNEVQKKEEAPTQQIMTAGPFFGLVEEMPPAEEGGPCRAVKCQVRISFGVLMESIAEWEDEDDTVEKLWERGRMRTEFTVVGMLMSALAGADEKTVAAFSHGAETLLNARGKLSGEKVTVLAEKAFDEVLVPAKEELAEIVKPLPGQEAVKDEPSV